MNADGLKNVLWIFIPAIIVLVAIALHWTSLTLNIGPDLAGKLTGFAFLSLLVERTVEVVMTLWRGGAADQLDLELARLEASSNKAGGASAR